MDESSQLLLQYFATTPHGEDNYININDEFIVYIDTEDDNAELICPFAPVPQQYDCLLQLLSYNYGNKVIFSVADGLVLATTYIDMNDAAEQITEQFKGYLAQIFQAKEQVAYF
ncbi:hypothetical protein PL78_07340 [Yersinia entomophaga]|uniref:Chaperone protein n=1 Tax=Yersinia entomophaga TaxID=935293 RepID=A0ABN4PRC7_YERET|nr:MULTISPECIES: hypothetical protein [Yersinia]ANI29643.1 hypothetical protein PL78_07340 [Yersinia entomophaga]OWF87741.1 hypothetical protein B4914_10125 [Yersinia entomophaga]